MRRLSLILLLGLLPWINFCRSPNDMPTSAIESEVLTPKASKISEAISEAIALAVEPSIYSDPGFAALQLISLTNISDGCSQDAEIEKTPACQSSQKIVAIAQAMHAAGCSSLDLEEGIVADLVISGATHWSKEIVVDGANTNSDSEKEIRSLTFQSLRLALYQTILERWSLESDQRDIYGRCSADLPMWTKLSPELREPVETACVKLRDNSAMALGTMVDSDYYKINSLILNLNHHLNTINGIGIGPETLIKVPTPIEEQLTAYYDTWAQLQAIPAVIHLYMQRNLFEKIGSRQGLFEALNSGKKDGVLLTHGTVTKYDFDKARESGLAANSDNLKYLQTVVPEILGHLDRVASRTPLARSRHIFGITAGRFPLAVGGVLAENPSNGRALCVGLKAAEFRREDDAAGLAYLGYLSSVVGSIPLLRMLTLRALAFAAAGEGLEDHAKSAIIYEVARRQTAKVLLRQSILAIGVSIPVHFKNLKTYLEADKVYGQLRQLMQLTNQPLNTQSGVDAISRVRMRMWRAVVFSVITGVLTITDVNDLLRVLVNKANGATLNPLGLEEELEIFIRNLQRSKGT